ncbi:pilus assembly protein HicB [Rhizobium sp. CC-YZS058]|uniref:pilus assembly protein HicB n=1 Tax=Rhizobium sp. CC-YZS058 TaxID=3042153 RepID=UPI002B0561AC|nr:pilus assembly protein HicB [Rhizobium sp. CC-YZS058]MEA3534120.1 pilus assembly protein HicB [Rhizobium sp. CC-YZS058]
MRNGSKDQHSVESATERPTDHVGTPLTSWIDSAVLEKVEPVEMAEDFLRNKARGATASGLDHFLRSAPNVPPQEGDEIPKGWPGTL